MAKAPFSDLLLYLRKVCAADAARDLSDAELLKRFHSQHDQAAFSVLVRRHGPMVLGVCRRVLGNCLGTEDAFQATFMVLVRRAGSISCTKSSLGSWLYAVAQRVATKARNQETTRRQRERRVEPMRAEEPLDDLTWQELRAVLDEEIAHLAEKYRAPLVLCYFQGKSYEQAARELGWPKSSLTTRLTRARELLRQQLVRRGMALSAGVLATALCEKVSAASVPAMLTIKTVKAAVSVAAGKAVAAGCLSAGAAALAREALKGTVMLNAKLVLTVLAIGVAVGGAGLAGYGGLANQPEPAKPQEARTPTPKIKQAGMEKQVASVLTDLYGDPLPEGALARLGTVRFRHGGISYAAAFSPDGKVMASGGSGSVGLCLWDAATGRLLRRLPVSKSSFFVAFSPNGKLLLRGGLGLIDIATGKLLHRLEGPDIEYWQVAFSPDGSTVAAGESGGSKVHLWDVATGKVIRSLDVERSYHRQVAFSPDGKTLASGGKTVRLWDAATGRELRELDGYGPVAYAPAGKVLASVIKEGIGLWDLEKGTLMHRLSVEKEDGSIVTVAFSPTGKAVASVGHTGTIRLWDRETGKDLHKWYTNSHGLLSATFSPDGTVLASVSGTDIRRWDTATGKEIDPVAAHTGLVASLSFTPDGKTLFSSGWDLKVMEWEMSTRRGRLRLFREPFWSPAMGSGSHQALSPDGKTMAWAGEDRVIRLWDTATGKQLQALATKLWETPRFSPDSKLLGASDEEGIHIWEVATGKKLYQLPPGLAFAFSAESGRLAYAGFDKNIHYWDFATGKELRRFASQNAPRWLIFSSDGKLLASAGSKEIRVWATETGKELQRFAVDSAVYSLAFSPSGRVVAAGGGGTWEYKNGDIEPYGTIHLWEVLSGQEIREIDGPQGLVWSLAFAPNGQTLASGGEDSTILLWDLAKSPKDGSPKPRPLPPNELDRLWSDLAGDAPAADRAIWVLAQAPQQSVALLKKNLQIVQAPVDQVAKLLIDLDSERYAVRQKAAKDLDDLGEAAEPAMRKSLDGNLTLEVRQRIEQILEKRNRVAIRNLRAIEALEQIGTTEAREVLQALANCAPNPRVVDAASAALRRSAVRHE